MNISRSPFLKMLRSNFSSHSSYSMNLQREKPALILRPLLEDRDDSSPVFYTSLNVPNKILHNCLMESFVSHHLIPKYVMDELGL
jgi:hypothetical protein